PPVVQPGSDNSTLINPCQRLNLVTEYICNMPTEFGNISLYSTTFATTRLAELLVRSWRYHSLHPDYIHQRIERLGQTCKLRLLLMF
ncbi:hypothetical protein EDB85DRAFT_1812980, partial [Lactarius pseudohatsudake]